MFEQPVVQLVAIVCMVIVALRVLNYFRKNRPEDGWMALLWGALFSVSAWGDWGVLAAVAVSIGLTYLFEYLLTKHRNWHR
jgi:chromate transport protein ChrA